MKAEYTAIDMATAAAEGFRDGQRAAQSAPSGEREAEAAAIAEEIDWLIRQWDAGVSWSGERMAELLEAAGKAAEMLTWREAIELTAITTNMPDEKRDKLLAIDDEPDAAAQGVEPHQINCNAVSQYPAGKCNCGKGE